MTFTWTQPVPGLHECNAVASPGHTCRARYWLRDDGGWFNFEIDRTFVRKVVGVVNVYSYGVEISRTIFDANTEADAKSRAEFIMAALLGVRE